MTVWWGQSIDVFITWSSREISCGSEQRSGLQWAHFTFSVKGFVVCQPIKDIHVMYCHKFQVVLVLNKDLKLNNSNKDIKLTKPRAMYLFLDGNTNCRVGTQIQIVETKIF